MKATLTYFFVIALLVLLSQGCTVTYPVKVVEVRTYHCQGYAVSEFVPVVDSAALRYYDSRKDYYRDYIPPADSSITVEEWVDTVYIYRINDH